MENLSDATREIMWNVPLGWLMYPLFLISLVSLGIGLYRQGSGWHSGKQDNDRLADYRARLLFTLKEILLQIRVRRGSIAGLFHSFFFYSFVVFVVTTTVIGLDYDFGTGLFKGTVYAALTLLSDLAGLLFLIGLLMAVWRRTVTRPQNLDSDRSDVIALGLLSVIILTGFFLEGLRIALAGDPWSDLSPVGYFISSGLKGLPSEGGLSLHAALWWIHTASVMLWIALIPYTRFRHLFILPVNIFFRKTKSPGELKRVDLEALMESEAFDPDTFAIGLDTPADLTWKQRLNLDSCVSCGRCDDVCPAVAAGLSLAPKRFIAGMKETLEADQGAEKADPTEFVGHAFDEMFSWHCRTCRGCDEVCPAYVEHVDNQLEIRRNEVNMKGRMPEELEQMLRQMETKGNPLGHQNERVKWTASLDAPIIGPGDSCDVLYWIGCLSTFDPIKQQIASDMIEVLKRKGVDFGILGEGERCCGDPARIAGEENLFQMTAKQQVEELNSRSFKTLLTSCPHCYNVLKNEYPQFGGEYQVMHHSEYLADNPIAPVSASGERSVVYHDPCYLGRYQGIYDPPRQVLESIPGVKTTEMAHSAWNSFCCGAGGGHFWMDIREGERINNLRVQQIRDAGADTVVTACPFCHHMLEDAVKLLNLEDEIQVRDIVSLLQLTETSRT